MGYLGMTGRWPADLECGGLRRFGSERSDTGKSGRLPACRKAARTAALQNAGRFFVMLDIWRSTARNAQYDSDFHGSAISYHHLALSTVLSTAEVT
jgi:hypothetical protein